MAKDGEPTYEVGFKKPPEATRFKKGQSGNPRGRPAGSKNKSSLTFGEERLKALLLEEAYRVIPIQEHGKSLAMPMVQAIIRSVAVSAAKGQHRAQRLFLETIAAIENERAQSLLSYYETLMDYKIDWEKEIAHCKQRGLPIPEPLPHPNDINVNLRTGKITVTGPMTSEEKKTWDELRARKADCIASIEESKQWLSDDPDCAHKKQILDDMAFEQSILDSIRRFIPD